MNERIEMEFIKEGCSCTEPLFNIKYLRTHRASSLKLIRCFPHCCPVHSYSSLCSTSIDVKITGLSTKNKIFLFARFQGIEELILENGLEIDSNTITMNTRTPENIKGEWIPGELRDLEINGEKYYYLNPQNNVGWHYGWVGTSTQAHRACFHHLVAYLFYCDNNSTMFRVISSLVSPQFIVMSYRRACQNCQKLRVNRSRADKDNECTCEGEFNSNRGRTNSQPVRQQSYTSLLETSLMEDIPTPQAMEKELELLTTFVSLQSIDSFRGNYHAMSNRLVKSLLIPIGATIGLDAIQRRAITFPTDLVRFTSNDSIETDIDTTRAICIDLLVPLASYSSLHRTAQFFNDHIDVLLDRDALYVAYISWIKQIHQSLSSRLIPMQMSLRQLCNRILQQSPYLAQVAEITEQSTPGFEYFVAQLREAHDMKPDLSGLLKLESIQQTSLCGRWMYIKTASAVFGSTDPWNDLSFFTLIRGLTMGYIFQLRLSDDVLRIKSDLHIYETQWCELVLDSTPRVFRVFPNGESSLSFTSGYLHGDYIGVSHTDQVRCDIFAWPLKDDFQCVYRTTIVFHITSEETMKVTCAVGKADLNQIGDFDATAHDRYERYDENSEVALVNYSFEFVRVL